MPCFNDSADAIASIQKYTAEYCSILSQRPHYTGLPPYIQPPRNSTRWQPRGSFSLPVAPDATDQLVFEERVPLGYDGIIIAVSNIWNSSGFVEGGGDITWRIKIDRRFIPFFDQILTTLGTLANPFQVEGQGIPLLSGQLVQYYANFAAGSEGRLDPDGMTLCAVTGYTWPRERMLV